MILRAGSEFKKLHQHHLRLDLLGPGCNWLCHLTVGMLGRVIGSPDPGLSAVDCAWLRLAWMVEMCTCLPREGCLRHQAVPTALHCKSAMLRLNGCHCSWQGVQHLQIQRYT